MDEFLIFAILFLILIFADLIPTIRKKDKKTLFFSIPVYLITAALDFMIALGVSLPPLNLYLKQIISSIFHMQ